MSSIIAIVTARASAKHYLFFKKIMLSWENHEKIVFQENGHFRTFQVAVFGGAQKELQFMYQNVNHVEKY